MDKEKELNELIALYAMRTRINNDQKRGEELLRLFIKEYEQVKSVDLFGFSSMLVANGMPAFGTKEFNDMFSNFFGGNTKNN